MNVQQIALYGYGVLLEGGNYALWGAVHVREEKRDFSTNRIILSDQFFDPELDLDFEETEKSFQFAFPNECWGRGFQFYAKESSELILHNYGNTAQNKDVQHGLKNGIIYVWISR